MTTRRQVLDNLIKASVLAFLLLPQKPGFGIELDETKIEKQEVLAG